MPRLAFFLVLFATSAMAGNLFEPLLSEDAGMVRGITGARVAVNADALLSSEPFVTLDDASYPLRGIAVEWRAGADFKAEFAIGPATIVSVLTKHGGHFAGVFYPPHGFAYELIPDAGGHTLRRASAAPFRCEVRSAGFAGAAAASAAALPPARRRAVGRPQRTVIDLAEFWTPRAEIIVGGRGPIEAIIRNAVDILNADTRQSGISEVGPYPVDAAEHFHLHLVVPRFVFRPYGIPVQVRSTAPANPLTPDRNGSGIAVLEL